jgi:gamma-glutamylcyclotransferase (GGCT)/AIG2-like uncharacterized protein YtfP
MTEDFLFVYGTLRRKTSSKMHQILVKYTDFVAEGTYQGRLYNVGHYPGVIPSDHPVDRVKGEVYILKEPETVLTKLDQYEECGPGFAQPTEYIRRREEITLSDNSTLYAWVYIYNRSINNLEWIPSGDYLARAADQVKFKPPR